MWRAGKCDCCAVRVSRSTYLTEVPLTYMFLQPIADDPNMEDMNVDYLVNLFWCVLDGRIDFTGVVYMYDPDPFPYFYFSLCVRERVQELAHYQRGNNTMLQMGGYDSNAAIVSHPPVLSPCLHDRFTFYDFQRLPL